MVLKYITEFMNIIRETYHQEEKNRLIDTQTIAISILAALSLLFIQFIAKTGNFLRFLQEFELHSAVDFFNQLFTPSEYGNLIQLLWFASFSLFFYLIFPMFFMRLFFKQRMSDYGLKLKGSFIYGKFYIVFMIFMVPIIMFVATFPSFQNTYPFYRLPYNTSFWPTILIWEVFYFLQFIGTEFFFRGFLIHGLKHRFGFYVIFVSMIPYCMIHFQKPFLEALGSILAGLILGVMSLRTNSVVMGIMLHYGVALLMDICAILMGNRSFLG